MCASSETHFPCSVQLRRGLASRRKAYLRCAPDLVGEGGGRFALCHASARSSTAIALRMRSSTERVGYPAAPPVSDVAQSQEDLHSRAPAIDPTFPEFANQAGIVRELRSSAPSKARGVRRPPSRPFQGWLSPFVAPSIGSVACSRSAGWPDLVRNRRITRALPGTHANVVPLRKTRFNDKF